VRPAVAAALALAMLITSGCRDPGQVADPVAEVVGLEPPPVEARGPTPAPEAAPTTLVPAPAPAPAPTIVAGPGPAAPVDAAALGKDLARVEAALRDPATAATELPALGLAQQVGYRQLAANPGWRPDVLRVVPPALHAAVVANTDAQGLLASLHKRRPTTLPAWRIVAPPPAASVLAAHQVAGKEIGVAWEVLAAIHLVETRMGRIRGTSTAGAKGPMQFLPATWGWQVFYAHADGDLLLPEGWTKP